MHGPRLHEHDEIHCPHCRGWHRVTLKYPEGTEYARAMMFYTCRDGVYYAGQVNGPSRWPTRAGVNSCEKNLDGPEETKVNVAVAKRS
ncbi:MAG: hypothetical protein ABL986_00180 [Vicinamibacterales bacterium]